GSRRFLMAPLKSAPAAPGLPLTRGTAPTDKRGFPMRTPLLLFLLMLWQAAVAEEVGEDAPAFSLPGLGNHPAASLSDYRRKVVYPVPWAPWCPPRLRSPPRISDRRARLVAARAPFAVIAVHVDPDRAGALDFVECDRGASL